MTNWKGAGAGVVWLELLQLVLVGCVARLVARGVVCAGTHYVDTFIFGTIRHQGKSGK